MTYTVHADEYMDEAWSLSDAAYRLHDHALMYSSRVLSDGLIPADRVKTLVPNFRPSSLAELIAKKVWAPAAGGYRIDFRHQQTAKQVRERRAAGAVRQQRWRAGHRGGDALDDHVPNGVPDGMSNGAPIQSGPIRSEDGFSEGDSHRYRRSARTARTAPSERWDHIPPLSEAEVLESLVEVPVTGADPSDTDNLSSAVLRVWGEDRVRPWPSQADDAWVPARDLITQLPDQMLSRNQSGGTATDPVPGSPGRPQAGDRPTSAHRPRSANRSPSEATREEVDPNR